MAERRRLLNSEIYSKLFIGRQKTSISSSHHFIFNTARLEISIYLGSIIIRLSYLKFKGPLSLGRKVQFFQSLRI